MSAAIRPARSFVRRAAFVGIGHLLLLAGNNTFASETNAAPADGWFTNSFAWPAFVSPTAVSSNHFNQLEAVESVGRLKVIWTPEQIDTNTAVRLFASADEPGHWPARDWREHPATQGETRWEFRIPVDDVDVPVGYFVEAVSGGRTNISPLRFTTPRRLGIEEPTRFFWSFIEGFESGTRGWHQFTPTNSLLTLTDESHTGRKALRVALPGNKTSATVGTTRIRGWQASQPRINGLCLWLRTTGGTAMATFDIHSDAFTERQRISTSDRQVMLSSAWQRVDLPFDSFSPHELRRVDWLSITFRSAQSCEVFMDDLQFLEAWASEPP